MTNGTIHNDNGTYQNGVFYPELTGSNLNDDFNDTLYGLEGDDILRGGAGEDFLDGGTGADTMYGGRDNDTYIVDNANDLVVEYANEGFDQVDSTVSYTLSANVETLYLSGTANINGYGNELDNFLRGNSGNNFVSGGAGNDYVYGMDGNDTVWGGSGDDYVSGGAGNDRIDGYATTGTEYDTLSGGTGSDTFVLGGGWGVSYQGTGYAVITDWDASADYIEAKGTSSQYSLVAVNFGGNSTPDMGIYYGSDLIAVVQDSTNVSFTRDFHFV